jgi:hypothetical protein
MAGITHFGLSRQNQSAISNFDLSVWSRQASKIGGKQAQIGRFADGWK